MQAISYNTNMVFLTKKCYILTQESRLRLEEGGSLSNLGSSRPGEEKGVTLG